MNIHILGTESLGVRGLCCLVETSERTILFDPGVSLGYRRQGFLPHPIQVAMGEKVRKRIIDAARTATDIVISHFHGDHMPLVDANPYQLSAADVKESLLSARLWTKGLDVESDRIRERVESLEDLLGTKFSASDGRDFGDMIFSDPVLHGEPESPQGTVMMTRVRDGDDVFVHASDIQLLDEEAVDRILDWTPDTVLLSGPPLYLDIEDDLVKTAMKQAKRLGENVMEVIIDHHLLRCEEGFERLQEIDSRVHNSVMCAASYMDVPIQMLEARRAELYEKHSVPDGWHEAYGEGMADTSQFREWLDEDEL